MIAQQPYIANYNSLKLLLQSCQVNTWRTISLDSATTNTKCMTILHFWRFLRLTNNALLILQSLVLGESLGSLAHHDGHGNSTLAGAMHNVPSHFSAAVVKLTAIQSMAQGVSFSPSVQPAGPSQQRWHFTLGHVGRRLLIPLSNLFLLLRKMSRVVQRECPLDLKVTTLVVNMLLQACSRI